MRIRSVKPEFWQSETISSVDAFSRLMAIALLNLSDDHGYFNATPAVVRGEVFPFEESLANISRALSELSRVGYICIGTTSTGKRVGRVVNFKIHQKVDHPSRLTFDVDSIVWDKKTCDSSRDPRETVASPRETLDHEHGAGSMEHGAGSMEHGAGSMEIQPQPQPQPQQKPEPKKKAKAFVPPTLEEVLAYCAEKMPEWHHSRIASLWAFYDRSDWHTAKGEKISVWKTKFANNFGYDEKNGALGPTKEWTDEQNAQRVADQFNRRAELISGGNDGH